MLGLAAVPNQDPRCAAKAFKSGVNYFFFYGPGYGPFLKALAALAGENRDDVILATGSGARTSKSLLAVRRKLVKLLDVNTLDIFFAEYINPSDDPELIFGDGGVLDQLRQWKAEGAIRYVGATTHDRALARRLVEDPRVDVLMHRFNMAHRKAVKEVFPVAIGTKTPVVAFTATRWGTLLEQRDDWPTPPSAADCYRYCLAQPAVRVVLSAPRSVQELRQNLEVLRLPTMSKRECNKWDRYGDLIYSGDAHAFETRWP